MLRIHNPVNRREQMQIVANSSVRKIWVPNAEMFLQKFLVVLAYLEQFCCLACGDRRERIQNYQLWLKAMLRFSVKPWSTTTSFMLRLIPWKSPLIISRIYQ